ncbi:MAG TPA: DNA primase [Candidatus Saccharimonadales bacterium]|nr:DNA primase [Candidatus Saccharimonadales bacterium]
MDAVEEIKSRLSIEDVVSQYVELKRAGRNFKGLSPFGNERTPSFMVSPEKQIWHDFSSGKGGNMFSFVMEMEGLDFKGALELLARKAGVDLDQYRKASGPSGKDKERLYSELELAAKFYQAQLVNQTAVDYIAKKRKFTRATVKEWLLGYSPNEGAALSTFLSKRKFSAEEIEKAGLGSQRYGRPRDMFRGRIMIPLQDPQGRVIGFTARLLVDDPDAPKYINTPQTVLYDKSRHVFGLHLAKEAIRKAKYVVIAEGNLDVISSHQAGVRHVVATAGTALTEQHLKALSRFTDDIRLCFDADSAGMNATERAIPIANKVGVSLSIITIPSGKDPDELIKQDVSLWQETIEKKEDVLDWLISRYASLSDLTSEKGRREFRNAVLNSLQRLENSGEQAHYADRIAKILNYPSSDAIMDELKLMKRGQKTYAPTTKAVKRIPSRDEKELNDYRKLQNGLLSIVFMHPAMRTGVTNLKPFMLPDKDAQSLLLFLQDNPDFAGEASEVESLRPIADYVKIVSLLFEELYQDLETQELRYEAARLQGTLIDRFVKTQKQRIVREMQHADEARTNELLEIAKKLDDVLKAYKGGA